MATARSVEFLRRLEQQRKTLREEIEDDIAPVRGLTLDQRGQRVESVCRDAMAILRGREDFAQALQAQEPRSDESMQTWLRLVKRHRLHGRH